MLAVFGSLTCAVTLAVAVPTSAHAATVKPQIVFNNPLTPTGARKIENLLVRLIKGAKAGSSIRASVYRFANVYDVSDALIAADRRGVSVRVIVDSGELGGQAGYQALSRSLGASKVQSCPAGRGCIGDKLNHNKFMLFSNTSSTKNVLMQSSQNFNATGGTTTDWNDAVVMTGATKTYQAYSSYFSDLWARKSNLNYWGVGQVRRDPTSTVQFFPKAEGDPVADMLDSVKCNFTTPNGKKHVTQIRIATGAINSKRDEVLTALSRLKRAGCKIGILVTENKADPTQTAAIAQLRAMGVGLGVFDINSSPNPMHSKYILVYGKIGSQINAFTWTGSPNLTWGSLHQDDETLLQLKKVGNLGPFAIHAKYRCNFQKAYAELTGRKTTCKY
jgi:phosphatidylserine/phosphatidylglycerophosphate/cardiolipin synthase-like enzyme